MADMHVFDFHFHCKDGVWLRKVLESGEVRGVLCCSQFGVAHEEFEEQNKDLLALSEEKGKEVLPLLATVHINKEGWQKHVEGWLKKYPQIVGIKLHPPASGFEITPELINPLFEFAYAHRIFVASHTCPVPGLSAISFLPSLKKFPRIRLVIYHGSTHEEAAYLAASFKHVYVEPSWLGMYPALFQMMAKLGGFRKILAGTDGPGWFDGFKGSPYLDLINLARHLLPDEETVRDFCLNNAVRFLGIGTVQEKDKDKDKDKDKEKEGGK